MPFTLAIAGRPNVGKSTLFNRLIGKAMALVDDQPGVTRDWREGEGHLFNLRFRLFDTAGLENQRAKGSIHARTAEQTQKALLHADVILFMIDGRMGLTPDDKAVAREIRKTGKPILLLVNKCEGSKLPASFNESAALGFKDPMPISATHGEGLDDLFEALEPYAPPEAYEPEEEEAEEAEIAEEDRHLHIAICGRPNAGKSTLLNKLIGEERMLTGPEPGLTRDSIQIFWDYRGKKIRLVDTAGMRRRARIDERLEKMSVQESLRAIRLAHVVILVLDASKPFDKQDYTIAQHVIEEGRALVVAINKWDTVADKTATMRFIQAKIEASMAQVAGVPLVTLSAMTGDGVDNLMKAVTKTYDVWNTRIGTGQLNRWLAGMMEDHPPPIVAGRRIKLRYMTQTKARPPTFAMWVNKPVDLPESYVRFLTNGIRKAFKLGGVPIRWALRKGENPYDKEKR
jgi:GTP-binding protein